MTVEQGTLISEPRPKLSARDMEAMLRAHYVPETKDRFARTGGVFAAEVGMNGSWGGQGSRRCDALYAGFTAASSRILIGHEIKVSRSDWRAELQQLDKADAWADACHAWYIVAPSTDVVPPEELPDGWGMMLPPKTSRGRRMTVKVKARVKRDHSPPWWAVRSLMARLDTLAHAERLEQVERLVSAEVERRHEARKRVEGRRLSSNEEQKLQAVAELEQRMGCELGQVEFGRIATPELMAEALQRVKDEHRAHRNLGHAITGLESVQQSLAAALERLRAATGEEEQHGESA